MNTNLAYRNVTVVGLVAMLLAGCLFMPYANAATLKKVVAVSRFENRSSWNSGGTWDLGTGMADQLTDALTQSSQFLVLERQTLDDVLSEQDLAQSGRMRKSKSAQTGKLMSAQILVKGTITEFSTKSAGGGGSIRFKGIRLGGNKNVAHVGLILRLINTTTGEVLASQRVEGKAAATGFKVGAYVKGIDLGTEGFKKTPLGKATQTAINKAVAFIAANLRTVPFQARVIKVTGAAVYVSAGKSTGASVGDVFTVYSSGEELVDPATGELLGVDETKLGQLKLIQVSEKFAKARPLGRLAGLKRGDIIRGL
jgi:curli biogenesis system outer membrane secretion channel CsgG